MATWRAPRGRAHALGPTDRRTSAAGPTIRLRDANSSVRHAIGQTDDAAGGEQLHKRPERDTDARTEPKDRQAFPTVGRLVLAGQNVGQRPPDPRYLCGLVNRQQGPVSSAESNTPRMLTQLLRRCDLCDQPPCLEARKS